MKMGIRYKKKTVIISAALILIAALIICGIFVFRSNQPDEPTLDEIVSDKLSAYQTDLTDSLETLTTNEKVADYLLAWATNKSISAVKDDVGNVIFSRKASSDAHKDCAPVIIACEYDADDMSSYAEPIAAALTVAKNAREHCAYRIIFMPREKGSMVGAASLSQKYLGDTTKLFVLGKSSSSKVSLATGGYEKFLLTNTLKRTTPDYDKAYKITVKLPHSQSLASRQQSLPNPIKQLGSLLASFKSSSFLFELSAFNGGEAADVTPSEASIVIVINAADEEKLITKTEKAINKFYDKYSEDFPEITYTYEEVDVPNKVLTKTDCENIISLLYTAPNGVYYKDDDGNIVAMTNVGKISTKNGKLSLLICSMSSSGELLDELSDSYATIAGLCSVNFKLSEKHEIYSGGGASAALLSGFEEAFLDFTGDSKMIVKDAFETTPCNILCEKNPNTAMLYCSVTEKTKEKFAGSLITYLEHGES